MYICIYGIYVHDTYMYIHIYTSYTHIYMFIYIYLYIYIYYIEPCLHTLYYLCMTQISYNR